jgi:hypothetical protein
VLSSKENLGVLKGMIFKDKVHLDEEFSHDGGQGNLRGFARQTEPGVKAAECRVRFAGQDYGAHVKSAPDNCSATADMALAFPRSALAGPRCQSCQCGSLLPIELAQFGHLAQDTDGSQRAYAVQLGQMVDLLLIPRCASEGAGEFHFDSSHLFFEMPEEFCLLAQSEGQGRVLGVLAGARELLLELVAPLDNRAQLSQHGVGQRICRRLECAAVGGEHSGIQWIIFSPAALSPGKVTDVGGIDDADRHSGGLQSGDDPAFIATGSFADNVDLGHGAQELDQTAMALGGVGQRVLAALEVELESGFGDVQASMDGRDVFVHSGDSVRAHSCTYEHVVMAAAPSTVRVTNIRYERFQLPREHVQTVPGCNELARPVVPRPAGRGTTPSFRMACSHTRKREKRYKAAIRIPPWRDGNSFTAETQRRGGARRKQSRSGFV